MNIIVPLCLIMHVTATRIESLFTTQKILKVFFPLSPSFFLSLSLSLVSLKRAQCNVRAQRRCCVDVSAYVHRNVDINLEYEVYLFELKRVFLFLQAAYVFRPEMSPNHSHICPVLHLYMILICLQCQKPDFCSISSAQPWRQWKVHVASQPAHKWKKPSVSSQPERKWHVWCQQLLSETLVNGRLMVSSLHFVGRAIMSFTITMSLWSSINRTRVQPGIMRNH